MQYQCAEPSCGHVFNAGQNEDAVSPAVQCPSCNSYHTQPYRAQPSPTPADMAPRNMPDAAASDDGDMGGNPLQEGILGDYQNRDVRDQSFASYRRSLFETPEFETTELIVPQRLYRDTLQDESRHHAEVQIPHGITDNLHATLGNLQAWAANPYENAELRPYNQYWKVIRPSYMKPGSLQVGVADPIMAEIINHVADTDDLTPLYEYRGRTSHTKTSGPLLGLLPEGAAALLGGGAAADAAGAGAGAAADLAAGGDAAASAGAAEAAGGAASGAAGDAADGVSAAGPASVMQRIKQGVPIGAGIQVGKGIAAPLVNSVDDLFGMGGGGGNGGVTQVPHDVSYYASVEDDAYPSSHDEIPKQDDGDYHEQDDGNQHEWQRDISVNGVGGTDHSPSFQSGGPAMERFMMLAPLLLKLLDSGESGEGDPLIEGLHQSLENELPGYLDHADPAAGEQLILMLRPQDEVSEPEPEAAHNEPDHTDENSGGGHESKVASLSGEAAEFLPDFTVSPPSLRGAALVNPQPSDHSQGILFGPTNPQEEALESANWPKTGPLTCPNCGHYGNIALGICPFCQQEVFNSPRDEEVALGMRRSNQPQWTPEQVEAVQRYIMQHAAELKLHGEELIDTVLSVNTNPLPFADILAHIQQADPPPTPPADAGFSAGPPMPAQEAAPPGATMPVPGMDGGGAMGQMTAAVDHYAADSVARRCPHCKGHTTGLIDEDGTSYCHSCKKTFKTETHPVTIRNNSAWDVDQVTAAGHDFDLDSGRMMDADTMPAEGVPAADQVHQRDLRQEQDSGHTWTDEDGNPLQVGQEYEMYTQKFDIPDLIRVEAAKGDTLIYSLTGEYGISHDTELTKQEANIDGTSFTPVNDSGSELDSGLETNDDDHTGYSGAPEQTDLSMPTQFQSSTDASELQNPKLAWLIKGLPRTAGASYTPLEQRALIDESGRARNSDLLALQDTHYVTDADDDQFLFGL